MRKLMSIMNDDTPLTRAEAAGMTALWVAIWGVMYGMAALMA